MNEKLKALYVKAHKAYREIHPLVEEIRQELQNYSLEDMADTSAVFHRAAQWLDEMRKKMQGYKEYSDRLACLVFLSRVDKQGRPLRNIKTEYCTATPRIKYVPKIPKKSSQPELYTEFMAHLGVTPEAIEFEAVRPHWPGVVEMASFRAAEGRPSLPGVDVSGNRAEYALTCRIHKNLEEERVQDEKRDR